MSDVLTWTAYNTSNIKKIYYKNASINVLHNGIDEDDYNAAMAEKDAEYNAMVLQKDTAYNNMVAQKNAEIAAAWSIVTYNSWTNYNRDGWWDTTWYDGDNYALIYRSNIWTENPLSSHIRIDGETKFLFWGFRHVYGANKWSYLHSTAAPFTYYLIDKSTNKISKWIVGTYNDSFGWTWSNRVVDCIIPSDWIEYQTEYRAYFCYTNKSSSYSDRCGSCIWYFYIKKDLSAMGYRAADDFSWRNQYWYLQQAYDVVDYNRTAASQVSDYNTNKIGAYNSSNVRYNGKLYTATWRSAAYNSSDWGYEYTMLYVITN